MNVCPTTPLEESVLALLDAAHLPPSIIGRILRLVADGQRKTGRRREHLIIEIPGKPISGNHRTYRDKDGKTKTRSDALAYAARIRRIVAAATVLERWDIPDYAAVDIEAINVNMDRDNIEKSVNDPLQHIALPDDRRILDGSTARFHDARGPRVIVTVRRLDGKEYGFAPARRLTQRVNGRSVRALPPHVQAAIDRAQR